MGRSSSSALIYTDGGAVVPTMAASHNARQSHIASQYAISVNRVLGIRAAPSLQAVPCPISAVAAQRPSYELHNYPANVKRLTVYDSSPFPWYQGFPNESTRITEAS